MRFLLLFALIAIGGAFALFLILGYFSGSYYQAEMLRKYPADKSQVWLAITDIEGIAGHKDDIERVEILSADESGPVSWKEYAKNGDYMVFERVEEYPIDMFRIKMVESSMGLTGVWTYKLVSEGTSTRVYLREDSHIDNVIRRNIMTITGRDAILKAELNYIDSRLR